MRTSKPCARGLKFYKTIDSYLSNIPVNCRLYRLYLLFIRATRLLGADRLDKNEYRSKIKFLHNREKSPQTVYGDIIILYGEKWPSYDTVP